MTRKTMTPMMRSASTRRSARSFRSTASPVTVRTMRNAKPTDDVYESIVDELFASPGYGECWAAMWMDIARYSDTKGYAEDPHRNIWPWRDWVIRAFNENMPYDQFTIEQIADEQTADEPVPTPNQDHFSALQKQPDDLTAQRNAPVRVPVMEDLPDEKRRDTFVHVRGKHLSNGNQVKAAVPDAFNHLLDNAPKNRLGVAQWLTADDNPLTARVTVNRFWAQMFGRGIVETEENFGTQGSMPTHQALLDWLAIDFRDNGWNVKRLRKQIAMSSAYR